MRQKDVAVRILMLGWEFPPDIVGGLGTACAGLTFALDRLGHDVTFVVPTPARLARERALRRDACLERIEGTHAAHTLTLPLVVGSAYLPVEARALAAADPDEAAARYTRLTLVALEQAGPFDIVHAHDWLAFAAGRQAATWLGKPWVAHVHSLEVDRAGPDGDARIAAAERREIAAAPAVIAVSRRQRDVCVQHAGLDASRARVVYNGVDGEFVPPRQPRSGHARTVLFLARLTAQKGPAHFLRAAAVLASRRPDVRFVMAGDGDLAPSMRSLAAELGIAGRVLFPGFLRGEAWTRAFRGADCFVMTSIAEPFGIAALEALQHGVPAIVPPDAGVAEAVTALSTCDPRGHLELASKVETLTFDQTARERAVRDAAVQASALTWSAAATACVGIYEGIHDSNLPRRRRATPPATRDG